MMRYSVGVYKSNLKHVVIFQTYNNLCTITHMHWCTYVSNLNYTTVSHMSKYVTEFEKSRLPCTQQQDKHFSQSNDSCTH